MIKKLIKHGNSQAIVIEKATLHAAGLDENAFFQVIVDPNGGITIQSVKPLNDDLHKKAFKEVLKENDSLMKRLSKR